jgi:hypothetical protein
MNESPLHKKESPIQYRARTHAVGRVMRRLLTRAVLYRDPTYGQTSFATSHG